MDVDHLPLDVSCEALLGLVAEVIVELLVLLADGAVVGLVLQCATDDVAYGDVLHVLRGQVRDDHAERDEGDGVEPVLELHEVLERCTTATGLTAGALVDQGLQFSHHFGEHVIEHGRTIHGTIFDAFLDGTFNLLAEGLDAHHGHLCLKVMLLNDQVCSGNDRGHVKSSIGGC